MNVAILVPVLNRPHRVQATIDSVAAATPEPHRLLFIAQTDDLEEIAALEAAGADYIIVDSARRSYARKINDGYRATTEPWLFLAADDLHFHPGWFTRALAWADTATRVIGTNDICNPRVMSGRHSTHTLVHRSYIDEQSGVIDQPGVVLNESYRHDWVDDEFVQTAMARKVYVHAFDSIVEHLHPNVGKAPDDDTYRLGRSNARQGQVLFQKRKRLWANL